MSSVPHRCAGCGASCTGVAVRPVDSVERARIEASALRLGVATPFDGDRLRLNGGRCVFVDPSTWRCRLHTAFGASSKPTVCRQFPLVTVRTAAGRLTQGVDPGCLHGLGTSPNVGSSGLVRTVRHDEEAVGLVRRAGGLPELGGLLGWSPAHAWSWLQQVPWTVLDESADLGPHLRAGARQLGAGVRGVAPDGWPDDEVVMRGVVGAITLRLVPQRGRAGVEAAFAGACAAVWIAPEDPRRLASIWFRLVRVL